MEREALTTPNKINFQATTKDLAHLLQVIFKKRNNIY